MLSDWNGDGRADVITGTPAGMLTVALGQGNGSFAVDRSIPGTATVLVVGDFTGDAAD